MLKKKKPHLYNARSVALEILEDKKNSYFSQGLMSKVLSESGLCDEDKALVTQIVYGINREQLFLDWAIENVSSYSFNKIENKVKNILRIGAYQILCLTRIPSYAAVGETVELAKNFYKKSTVNFVNAVLRNIDRKKEEFKEGPVQSDIINFLSIYYSHPKWLIERWYNRWGREFTEKFCYFNNKPPAVTVRTNRLKTSQEGLVSIFEKEKVLSGPLHFLSSGFEILSHHNLEVLTSYKDGLFTVQSESSMIIGTIVAPKREEDIIDLCAAPGNKTTHMAELMDNNGSILALDVSETRLSVIKDSSKRLGIKIITPVVCNTINFKSKKKFHRVLLDAPCSGTGVLSRRSDLRWNKSPQDIKKLSNLQFELLVKASSLVKSGGTLVYSVCSIEPEEGVDLVKRFILSHTDFASEELSDEIEGINLNSSCGITLLPPVHNTEGFFVARLKKK